MTDYFPYNGQSCCFVLPLPNYLGPLEGKKGLKPPRKKKAYGHHCGHGNVMKAQKIKGSAYGPKHAARCVNSIKPANKRKTFGGGQHKT